MRFSYLVGLPPISPVQNTPSSCAFKSYIHTLGTNQIAETHPSIQSNTVNPSNTQVNHKYSHCISTYTAVPSEAPNGLYTRRQQTDSLVVGVLSCGTCLAYFEGTWRGPCIDIVHEFRQTNTHARVTDPQTLLLPTMQTD